MVLMSNLVRLLVTITYLQYAMSCCTQPRPSVSETQVSLTGTWASSDSKLPDHCLGTWSSVPDEVGCIRIRFSHMKQVRKGDEEPGNEASHAPVRSPRKSMLRITIISHWGSDMTHPQALGMCCSDSYTQYCLQIWRGVNFRLWLGQRLTVHCLEAELAAE